MSEGENRQDEEGGQRKLSYSRFYSGPLPPEDTLAGYERVLPGGADRVFSMVERQQRYQFIDQILKSSINLLGLLLIVGLAALFVLHGAPELVAALAAATPTVIALSGGIVTVWRNARKGLMDRERHKQTLRLEAEQHDLDIQIRREEHQLEMQIKRDRHLHSLEAGEQRLSLPNPTVVDKDSEDDDSDAEIMKSAT